MEPTNEINKYIVVVYKNQKNFSSFTKRKKTGKFTKLIFYRFSFQRNFLQSTLQLADTI